jgi:Zn-finger nucleic acid-binding protein
MLIACSACHRQYDVGALEPGRKVRCTCGELATVPRRKPRKRAVARCGNCGAELPADGKRCEHCAARVTLAEEGMGEACPECFAHLVKDARFCSACGTALAPRAVLQAVTRSACPRCDELLAVTEGRNDPFHQCTVCGGIWFSRDAFQRFLDRSEAKGAAADERRAVASEVRTRRRPRETRPLVQCPVCGIVMLVQEFAGYSSTLVDACARHGWWFDPGELERIRRFVAAGGPAEAEKRRKARRRSQRTARSWRRAVEQERRGGGDGELLAALLSILG